MKSPLIKDNQSVIMILVRDPGFAAREESWNYDTSVYINLFKEISSDFPHLMVELSKEVNSFADTINDPIIKRGQIVDFAPEVLNDFEYSSSSASTVISTDI